MQEKKNQTMINEEKLLKKLKREAAKIIREVESGLYDRMYDFHKKEIEDFYDDSDKVARDQMLILLEQDKQTIMEKYKNAKLLLERIPEFEKEVKLATALSS